jgi:excisionase family DNA binding protein
MRDLDEKMSAKLEGHLAPLALLKEAVRQVLREELPRVLAELQQGVGLPVGVHDSLRRVDGLIGVEAAARHLGLAAGTVYKLARKCELPSVKMGTRLLFKLADLDAYAAARRRSPERVTAIAAGAIK